MVDVLGYLLFASGLHMLMVTVNPSDGQAYDGGTQTFTFSVL